MNVEIEIRIKDEQIQEGTGLIYVLMDSAQEGEEGVDKTLMS